MEKLLEIVKFFPMNLSNILYNAIISNNKIKDELKEIVNISIKETMARSIYTSLTTLLPVIALLIMGSREILTFNVAMIVGLIAGTYSSLLLAGWLYVFFASKRKNNNKNKRKEISEKTIKGIND